MPTLAPLPRHHNHIPHLLRARPARNPWPGDLSTAPASPRRRPRRLALPPGLQLRLASCPRSRLLRRFRRFPRHFRRAPLRRAERRSTCCCTCRVACLARRRDSRGPRLSIGLRDTLALAARNVTRTCRASPPGATPVPDGGASSAAAPGSPPAPLAASATRGLSGPEAAAPAGSVRPPAPVDAAGDNAGWTTASAGRRGVADAEHEGAKTVGECVLSVPSRCQRASPAASLLAASAIRLCPEPPGPVGPPAPANAAGGGAGGQTTFAGRGGGGRSRARRREDRR